MHRITDQNIYTEKEISEQMFGLNFVLSYDMEFLEEGPLLDLLGDLQPDSLRYPGGSITEMMFGAVDYGKLNWAETYLNSLQNGFTQRDNITRFVETAASIESSIQLVLPTRIAFQQTAGQAIAAGTYGDRREIYPQYFQLLEDYIDEFLDISTANGVAIERFEIGNEFWGSGWMTASEYGYLAATVTDFLNELYPEIDIIAQVTYNAGLYSPVEDTPVFLTENGEDFDIHFLFEDLSQVEGLIEHTLPGQGSGVGQTQAIGREFASNPAALAALDGIVDHVYFRKGFDGIDNERNHALINIPQTFEDYSGSGSIPAYITEWSVRNTAGDRESEDTNHEGLQYASSTLEAFFEFASTGVQGASFWPLTFGNENIDRRVLIDTSDQDYTFGGEIFRILSNNLVGLSPVFDYETPGEVDIHGFSSSESLVFFVSERSGERNVTTVDFSEYSFESDMFVSITYLSEDGVTGTDLNANPVILESGGFIFRDAVVDLDLDPWSLAVVDVQVITVNADHIVGSNSNDNMRGDGGNDRLEGLDGNDSIAGNFGNDTILGGNGSDTLKGGYGSDYIDGGDGNDFVAGTFGANHLDGGAGNDTVIGSQGSSLIWGGDGNDRIELQSGASLVDAGSGNDEIFIRDNEQFFTDNFVAYNAGLTGMGTGHMISIFGYHQNSNVIDGGDGWDVLNLSTGNDAFFLDDRFSDFHQTLDIDGPEGYVARIEGIERINAGFGDDIIDLTSSIHSLLGTTMEIYGEGGNDVLWGSDANETLFGGAGDDQLFGGFGADVLTGGGGSDIFEFSIYGDRDTISDFNLDDQDVIRIYGAAKASGYSMSWDGVSLDILFEFGLNSINFSIDIHLEENSSNESIFEPTWEEMLVLV